MLTISRLVNRNREDESGIVGFNLAVVIAFALYAVIQLSRVVLAGSQIDDRVKVIITEVGPGSNVSRLDETQKLNETGRMAEEILVAARATKQPAVESPEPQELFPAVFDAGPLPLSAVQPLLDSAFPHESSP